MSPTSMMLVCKYEAHHRLPDAVAEALRPPAAEAHMTVDQSCIGARLAETLLEQLDPTGTIRRAAQRGARAPLLPELLHP